MQVVPKPVATVWQTILSWFHAAPPLPDWQTEASQQNLRCFVVWLASQVARDLLDNKPYHLSREALVQSVWDGVASDMQQQAEHFLRHRYYVFPEGDAHFFRVLRIFRHYIQKRIRVNELH